MSQVVEIQEDCDDWKRLWSLKTMVIVEKYGDNWKRLWWLKKILHAQKAQKHEDATKQKHENAYKQISDFFH